MKLLLLLLCIVVVIYYFLYNTKIYKKQKYKPKMLNYVELENVENVENVKNIKNIENRKEITTFNIDNSIQDLSNKIDELLIENNNDNRALEYLDKLRNIEYEQIEIKKNQNRELEKKIKLQLQIEKENETNRIKYIDYLEKKNKEINENNKIKKIKELEKKNKELEKINKEQIQIQKYIPTKNEHKIILKNIEKKIIYNDTQNVHNTSINDNVLFISKNLIDEYKKSNFNIENYLSTLLNNDLFKNTKIINTVSHIKKDKSRFKDGVTLIDTLFGLLNFIYNHKDKKELEKRLSEELYDMNNLCATGHLSRLVNVIQGFDINENNKIKISKKDELYAIVSKDIQNDITDEILDWIISDKKKFEIWLRQFIITKNYKLLYSDDEINNIIIIYLKN